MGFVKVIEPPISPRNIDYYHALGAEAGGWIDWYILRYAAVNKTDATSLCIELNRWQNRGQCG
jgi:hypothetical protein